jgi:hypothetical protein
MIAMDGTSYTLVQLRRKLEEASDEIRNIRSGMHLVESPIEREYRLVRTTRLTLDQNALKADIASASKEGNTYFAHAQPLEQELALERALVEAYVTPERREQFSSWIISFNQWGHLRVEPMPEEQLEPTEEEIHARVQKERATEHAYELWYHQRSLQDELQTLDRLTEAGAKQQCNARIDRARALLAREEEYFQRFTALGEWPERPALVALAEVSDQAHGSEENSPVHPDPVEPANARAWEPREAPVNPYSTSDWGVSNIGWL